MDKNDSNNKTGGDVSALSHVYDGIVELDNPLPTWWLVTFYGTIIFGFIYMIHYGTGSGPTGKEELNMAMREIESIRKSNSSGFDEKKFSALIADKSKLEAGQKVYTEKCQACHGPNGGGLIGPNLTDNSWINGDGSNAAIFNLVAKGVPAKGMPAWAEQLSEDALLSVSAFVVSLKNTNVAGGKPAQGNVIQ